MNQATNVARASEAGWLTQKPSGFSVISGRSNRVVPVDFAPQPMPEGTVTLMFGSLEELGEMTERLGDQAAYQLLKAFQSIIRAALHRHGGFEVELQGDGFLLAFAAANRALRCAIDIARSLSRWSAEHADLPLRARIGLHVGEPIKEGKRFFGKPVIVAARIAGHALGGEIMVSSLLKDLLSGNGDLSFDEGHEVELKGLCGKQRVHAVLWDSSRPRREPAVSKSEPVTENTNCFRLDGDFWTIAYEGRTSRIRDAKGLRYIATLLRRPGEEVHVADFAGASGEPTVCVAIGDAEVGVGLGDAGEVIDRQARAEYHRRIESLDEEIEEAKRWNDTARLEAREKERDFLVRELAGAFGLGGRARRVSDASERARKAVTSRIRDSIGRIEQENPVLARHLAAALRLGTFCRYEPEVSVTWGRS